MSRNANSFFSEFPATVDIGRSRFDRDQNIKLSMDAGELVPFYVDEVLPGDTHSIDTSKLVRMSTLIAPIMDDIYLDTYYFFVPNRIIWTHWKNFMGESERAWLPAVQYSVPQIFCSTVSSPSNAVLPNTIADYMGVPVGVSGTPSAPFSFSALPIRAYVKIFNEWFRDENLTDPLLEEFGDSSYQYSGTAVRRGGYCAKVAKLHDYFTSSLPSPQRGPDVLLPLGNQAPISGNIGFVGNTSGLNFALTAPTTPIGPAASGTPGIVNAASSGSSTADETLGLQTSTIYADLSQATGSSINQLRLAFQVQKLYEKDARGGTRYREMVKSHFGVNIPDSRVQIPEYLGGNRIPINIHQVVQNSATDSVSPQGHTAAYSLTLNSHSDFTKSFTEHGYIIGVMCIRYKHTYQQGLERFWSRKDREDFYFPVFANIGEQAILNKEIYAQGTSADDEVFGYQEAWADYRFKPSRVSGELRSTYAQSLDFWHLGDYYTSQPYLSDAWIREDKSNIDRALAVTSAVSHQFVADIYVQNRCVRPMPLYSIPGLIDHH